MTSTSPYSPQLQLLLTQVANRWSARSRQILAADHTTDNQTAWLRAQQAADLLNFAAKKVKEADLVAEIAIPVTVQLTAQAAMDALKTAIEADIRAHATWTAYCDRTSENDTTTLDFA